MDRKRTKIVATISDKNCGSDFIKHLYEAGMDVIRINSAHLTLEAALVIIENTRKVSNKIAILIDTKGPEIRTTECDSPVRLTKGGIIRIAGNPDKKSTEQEICVSHSTFSSDVPTDSTILIDDGELEFRVKRKMGNALECSIENDGILGSRKSVNVPGVRMALPSLTDKDRAFIEMASWNNVDFIAHSFVRTKQDILDVRDCIESIWKRYKDNSQD